MNQLTDAAAELHLALEAAGREDIEAISPRLLEFGSSDLGMAQRLRVLACARRFLNPAEVEQHQPHFVVVEDRDAEMMNDEDPLVRVALARGQKVLTVSSFIDRLWGGERAHAWASLDAGIVEDPSLYEDDEPPDTDLIGSFVEPTILRTDVDGGPESSYHELLRWIDHEPTTLDDLLLVVTGDAGSGKSQLTRHLHRRSVLNYTNARARSSNGVVHPRPPLTIRVPLRDFTALSSRKVRDHLMTEAGLGDLSEIFFSYLLLNQRLILLLDGFDEMSAPTVAIGTALQEFERLSTRGAKILLTARGRTADALMSPEYLEWKIENQTASAGLHVGNLTEDRAIQLLTNLRLPVEDARRIVFGLPEGLKGVPLVLIWSTRSDRLPSAGSGVSAYLDLVDGICRREQTRNRTAIPPDLQVRILTDCALELERRGSLSDEDFAVLAGTEDDQFVVGPHALLAREEQSICFRHDAFFALMLALGLAKRWRDEVNQPGFRGWLLEWFGRRTNAQLTTDYLSELLDDEEIASAWEIASIAPHRNNMSLRRNLVALALAKVARVDVDTVGQSGRRDPSTLRSTRLSSLLPNQDLGDCRLDKLVFSQFSFAGWSLRNVSGDVAFAFCDFRGAHYDLSILDTTCEDCVGLDQFD